MFEKSMAEALKEHMKARKVCIKYVMLTEHSCTVQFGGSPDALKEIDDDFHELWREINQAEWEEKTL